MTLEVKALENIVGKGENVGNDENDAWIHIVKKTPLSSHKHKHMYLNYDMKSMDIVTWSKWDRKACAVVYEKYTC